MRDNPAFALTDPAEVRALVRALDAPGPYQNPALAERMRRVQARTLAALARRRLAHD